MQDSCTIRKAYGELVTLPQRNRDSAKQLNGRSIAQVKNQTSKSWLILACVVGALTVGAGTFGGIGLLHSHGFISLPQYVASAIGTVGNTPPFWSLWLITVGSVVGGVSTIIFATSKAHTQIIEEKRLEGEVNKRAEGAEASKALEKPRTVKERAQDRISFHFQNCFNELGISSNLYQTLEEGAFIIVPYTDKHRKGENIHYIVIRNQEALLCTRGLNKGYLIAVLKLVKEAGYCKTQSESQTTNLIC